MKEYFIKGGQFVVAVLAIAALIFLAGLVTKFVWKLFIAGFNLW